MCTAARRANGILDCIKHNTAIWSKEAILPIYPAQVYPHFEFYVQFWAPLYKKVAKVLESTWVRATQQVTGLEGIY